jgi:hypothetical protein
MNRYTMIRRLRAPAILLLIGILALLHQMEVIPYFWRLLWPLLLIVLGLLLLAERAALAWEGYPPFPGAPGCGTGKGAGQGMNSGMNPGASPGTDPGTIAGAPFQGAGPGAGQGAANSASDASGALVSSQWQEFDGDKKGGQS